MEQNQPTYSQEMNFNHQNQSQIYQLPSNFLETEDNNQPQDSMLQQRIISGEYAPEPTEFCNVINEPTYNQYDPFQPSFANQQQSTQHFYQQSSDSFAPQYGQIEDPWIGQQDSNAYAQEEFDPTYSDQFGYEDEQPTSSNVPVENPFEEEEPYEPTTINTRPTLQIRRLGQPPSMPTTGPITRTYKLVYARPQVIRPASHNVVQEQPVARPPRKQLIKRDSEDDNLFISKDGTEKARSQAAQRLRTPEGWSQFNQWLKKAQEEKDRKKITSLLELCLEADIPAELLTQKNIDTPKVVKLISRKHPNATINRLSNELIDMWKKTITANTKAQSKQKTAEKTPKPVRETTAKNKTETPKQSGDQPNTQQYTANENLLDMLTEAMDKRNDPTTASTTAPTDDASKRPRTKTKVKLSKPRLTGLEEEPVPKTAAKKEKPIKKKPAETVVTPPPVVKPAQSSFQKRQLQESDMFMAAFDDAPKKPTPAKKLKVNKVVKVVQPDVPESEATSPTVKSEFDIKPESSASVSKKKESIDEIPIIRRDGGTGILRRQALTPEEKSVRKIRFNDQFGKDLVQIRHFDVEEGERINVAKIFGMNIKRWEMEDEGKHFRHKGIDSELSVDDSSMFTNSSSVKLEYSLSPTLPQNRRNQMPPLPLSGSAPLTNIAMDEGSWNLLPIEKFDTFVRGGNSYLGKLEADRERNAMAAFIDPNIATHANGEDDPDLNAAADSVSHENLIRIPLVLRPENQKTNDRPEEIMEIDPQLSRQSSSVIPPLPFSNSSSLIQTVGTFADPHLEFQQSVLNSLPSVSPPIITSTPSIAPTNKIDAFMELLKKQAAQVDQDLRPGTSNDEQMDQDLRPNSNSQEPMEYDIVDTPMSPPSDNATIPVKSTPVTTAPSSGLTIDALNTLAALAGKDTNSVSASLSLVGGLDLASILSKVESAQSNTQSHQYTQEDPNVAPPVITQIHSDYFQQAGAYGQHSQFQKPGNPRYPTPGVRSTSTNPRAGYFQTPTNMSRFRTVPCKYFLAGTCNFGEACRFLHATPDGQIFPHKPGTSTNENQYEQEDEQQEDQQQDDDGSSSFQLALAPKNSNYSMEAAANFMQRGSRGHRGRGFRGRRGGFDDRPPRNRDRRSPRRYEERRRYSPSRRRRKSRSVSSNDSNAPRDTRSRRRRSVSPDDDSRSKRRERSRSPNYDEKSPSYYERQSPDRERSVEDKDERENRRSSRRSSRQDSP